MAIDQDPNNVKAHLAMATMLWQARKYTDAEEHARFVVEHDPNNIEGYLLLGNVLLGEKHPQEAIDMYTKASRAKAQRCGPLPQSCAWPTIR